MNLSSALIFLSTMVVVSSIGSNMDDASISKATTATDASKRALRFHSKQLNRILDEEDDEEEGGGDGAGGSEDDEEEEESESKDEEDELPGGDGAGGDEESEDSSSADEAPLKASKGPKKRKCKLDTKKDDEVKYECKAEIETDDDTEIEDEIKYKVKVDDSVKVKVEYEQEIEIDTEGTETETETETQYEVSFSKLIEYKSSSDDGDEAYDWEDDEIVQEIMLDDFESGISDVTTSDEGISTFSTSNGIVTFYFSISQAGEDESLNANRMKIDFELTDFPWQEDDTLVALLASVKSKKEIKVKEEGDKKKKRVEDISISFADAVSGVGFSAIGEFSWVKTASAMPAAASNSTNTTEPLMSDEAVEESVSIEEPTITPEQAEEPIEVEVVATSPEASSRRRLDKDDETVDEIAFSFLGAGGSNEIFWDPSAGVSYESSGSRLTWFLVSLATLAASCLMAMA